MDEKVKTFKEWAWDEGFDWPLKPGSDERAEAFNKYIKFLRDNGIENPETIRTEEGKKMARILGIYFGCKRPDMKVNAQKEGLCGSCQLAVKGTEKGSEDRDEMLVAQAEKWAGKGKMQPGQKVEKVAKEKNSGVKKTKTPSDPPAPAPVTQLSSRIDVAIGIPFAARYLNIFRLFVRGKHANL